MARELRCLNDLDPYLAECADPVEEFRQDVFHQLLEPANSNIDDPERGFGLDDQISGPLRGGLEKRLAAYYERDARVTKCSASVTRVSNGNAGDTVTIELTFDMSADDLNLEGYKVTVVKDAGGYHLQTN